MTTERKPVKIHKKIQLDISSALNVNAPLCLIAAHQKTKRLDPADPASKLSNCRFNNATFDNVTVKKYFEEIDGIRYPEDLIINIYTEKNYPNQYRDPNLLYKV